MDKLTEKILGMQPEDWNKYLTVPWVYTFKNTYSLQAEPILYHPSMIFITSWSKVIHLDDKSYSYGKWKFLLVAFQTPFICEANVDWVDVFAWINIRLDPNNLYDLIKDIKGSNLPTKKKHNLEPWVLSLDITDKIYNAVDRLLDIWDDEYAGKILWPSIIKEIMFYAIQESDAQSFCDLILTNSNVWPFGNMIEMMVNNYKSEISIESLAHDMDMSIPTFYRQFKAFTGFSPNQYIKNLRLNKAKDLLNIHNYSVKQAASEVWYNSQFQFSREYKRYFGYAPVNEGK